MQTEMESEAFENLSPIQKFFFGKSVFITGATGFVGKVLVEKLLRCCPGIGMLYLMMRPKKSKSPQERLDRLFKAKLFDKLTEVYPEYRSKVCLVEGNLLSPRLGISDEDFKTLQNNVSVVFHSAARVIFNDPLKSAVEHNLIATKDFLNMCHGLPKLVSVVHVSTSYVQREPDGSVLEEIPTPKLKTEQLLSAMQWMDDKSLQSVTDFLLEGKLTTYLVTKAMGEVVIAEERRDLPTAIIRPCNISPTWKDPFPGWCDSIQGVSGLLLAGAKGVLRTLLSVKDLKLNIVPVDLVVNSMITSAWHVAINRPNRVYIVNCVFDYENLPLADEAILQKALAKRTEYPLARMYRYPDFKVYYNWLPYKVHSIIDEWIPAYTLDFFLYLFTGQTVLVRVYKKINFIYDIFFRLGKEHWICRMENYHSLTKSLSETDSEMFFLESNNFDWDAYIDDCFIGGRKFLAKEDPSNIPYAKKKAKIWWLVTTILKWCIIFYVFYCFFPRSMFNSLGSGNHIFEIGV